MSINKSEFSAKKGERFDIKKPKDSNIFKGEGQMINKSTSQNDYGTKIGDRFDVEKPGTSKLWEVSK